MKTGLVDTLHHLTAIWGPAGREHKVIDAIRAEIEPFVDQLYIDRFGNLIGIRKGIPGGRRVMLAAHMDTIGAIALNVSEKGLIHLAPVGRMAAHFAIGHSVVWGSGLVGFLQHEPVKEAREIEFKRLWCDIGAVSQEEALANLPLGDMCVLSGALLPMGEFLAGPGLDNRAGCAVLVEVARHLQGSDHEVVFAFTAQGEIGPRGAGPAAYATEPDLALVLDVAEAGDIPKGSQTELKLGHGPALKLKDGAYMAHQGLSDLVRTVADSQLIPLQTEIVASPQGHNDAQVVTLAGQGIPTAVIDIPVRYRGTAGEMLNVRDLHAAVDLVLKLLADALQLA